MCKVLQKQKYPMYSVAYLLLLATTSGFSFSPRTSATNKILDREISTEKPLSPQAKFRIPQADYPTLTELKQSIDPSAFKIDTLESLKYFGIDFSLIAASTTMLHNLLHSEFYQNSPLLAHFLLPLPLQFLSGTFLWAMWCIGHDAGHGTVSKNQMVNEVVGEISHSMLCLTPFDPWRRSHKKHHLNHNHLTKDYSHQWFSRDEELPSWIRTSYETRNLQLPVLYLVYLLLGIPDGGHVWLYGRVWEGATKKELLRGSLSSLISTTFALTILRTIGVAEFTEVFFVPWLVMSSWLFTTTYLQHHSDDTKLYTDDTWTFAIGGFETIDRDYGKIVNAITHNMSSDHVAHHLFPWTVPHYHLPAATAGITGYLEEKEIGEIYQTIESRDFPTKMVKAFDKSWFFVDPRNIVR